MIEGLKRSRLLQMLSSLNRLNVMVVGDFALDAYWYADMTHSELSRETPHYNRPVTRENYSPGASGNICWNVKDLGVNSVFAVTIVGKDWRGDILAKELEKMKVSFDYALVSSKRVTSTYVKPILCGLDSQQEDSRIDFVNFSPLSGTLENDLIKNIQIVSNKVDLVIVEDQMDENGIITNKVRESLIRLAEECPAKTFIVDSRKNIGLFRNMILKPNRLEALRAVLSPKNPREIEMDELVPIGIELQKKAKRPIYITLSENGALLVTESAHYHLPSAPTKPPIDPVGAGDTFMSSVGAALAGGADPVEAGVMANIAAGVILKKLNITGTASPEEILTKFDEISTSGVWP